MSDFIAVIAIIGVGLALWYFLSTNTNLLSKRPASGLVVTPRAGGGGGSQTTTEQCDESLWDNVWQVPNIPRLQVVHRCTTVTGKVGRTSQAPDGDYNFDLKPDPPYASMASKGAKLHNGYIWCEVICQHPLKKSIEEPELDKYRQGPGGCKSYKGKKFSYLPKTGDRVAVTGAYVKDIREGGHMEFHPVSNIRKL